MKFIELSKGFKAIVDDDDYEYLSQWKWYYSGRYAVRGVWNGSNAGKIYMHRLIAGTPDGFKTDHVNLDKLDNRRGNLRICSDLENSFNKAKVSKLTSSVFKGVVFRKSRNKWQCSIAVNSKKEFIGLFDNEIHAGIAYDLWAIDIQGQFANTNFVVAC